jgi:hypothetical protein
MSHNPQELIGVSASTARELEYLARESECSVDTVLAELIAHMGGKELAAIKIFHRHHDPVDTLEPLPPVLVETQSLNSDEM